MTYQLISDFWVDLFKGPTGSMAAPCYHWKMALRMRIQQILARDRVRRIRNEGIE